MIVYIELKKVDSTVGVAEGFLIQLNLNATETSQWGILSRDLKKVIKAWPTEVAFDDGTKWKASKNENLHF